MNKFLSITHELLERHSLTAEKVLHAPEKKIIYLLKDKNQHKYVLKIYDTQSQILKQNLQSEIKFLKRINSVDFKYIQFPRIIDNGENYLLMSYIEREHTHRSTVLNRKWSDDDIKLWVAGLVEFQNVKVLSSDFTLKKRVLGFMYPVYRMFTLIPKCRNLIDWKAFLTISKLSLLYICTRLYFRNVLTHYDLHTYNFSFVKNERKMSMLDFEKLYYLGDFLYDILCYITIPIQKMKDWTFQTDLLNEFIKQKPEQSKHLRSLLLRIRFILLVRNFSRYLNFLNDSDKKAVYSENVKLLLNGKSYYDWVSSALNLQSTCCLGASSCT